MSIDNLSQMQQNREYERSERLWYLRKLYPAGKVFRDGDTCPEMVVVPEGSFLMGSPESEKYRERNEGPVHPVTIVEPFAVGKFAVTFQEWQACVSDGGCSHRPHDMFWGGENRPVIRVSWKDAQKYVSWLSERTGEGYRLLSESEWEYVARAGTTGPFQFGSTISTDQANYNGYKGELKIRSQTVPVGSFPANIFGLHEVHGNVWEWVEDCWHPSYNESPPTDGSAWTWGGNCDWRVLRGGSWNVSLKRLRVATRLKLKAETRSNKVGFRVARTLAT